MVFLLELGSTSGEIKQQGFTDQHQKVEILGENFKIETHRSRSRLRDIQRSPRKDTYYWVCCVETQTLEDHASKVPSYLAPSLQLVIEGNILRWL